MDKKAMLEAIISHYSNGNKSKFAQKIGVTPQAINSWISRNTFDIDLIYAKCEGIDARWLLTGEGDMISEQRTASVNNGVIANGSDNRQMVVTSVQNYDESFWKELVKGLRDDLKYWKDRCTSAEDLVSRMQNLRQDENK